MGWRSPQFRQPSLSEDGEPAPSSGDKIPRNPIFFFVLAILFASSLFSNVISGRQERLNDG